MQPHSKVAAHASRDAFLETLEQMIRERVERSDQATVIEFSRRFHARVPEEDLLDRELEDVYGATLAACGRVRERDPRTPLARVFNPRFDREGWQSSHTVLQVHHLDMPFITDSVLMMLAQRDLTLHFIQNMVIKVQRDGGGAFRALADGDDPDAWNEVIIHAEIDRVEEREFAELERTLLAILEDVRAAVGDFHAMRRRVEALIDELEQAPPSPPAADIEEARAFLRWLTEDNFTFLGYQELEFDTNEGRPSMRSVDDAALGVMRSHPEPSRTAPLSELEPETRAFILEPVVLQFSKGGARSRVHRPAYPDYIAVKRFDAQGRVIGERGILGLYTFPVYGEPPERIPVLRRKVASLLRRAGLDRNSFDGRVLRQVVASFPRDELFQASEAELVDVALRATYNRERKRQLVFVRRDPYGLFITCLVYTPRERYNTRLREQIQAVLIEELAALDAEFTTYFSESVLVRTYFVLRVDLRREVRYDEGRITQRIRELAQDWDDTLRDALVHAYGEGRARQYMIRYGRAFPASYREYFHIRAAVHDIEMFERLMRSGEITLRLYRLPEAPANRVRLKVFHHGPPLPLSDLLPLMENLGLRVLEEHPFAIDRRGGASETTERVTIHDFALEHAHALDLARLGERFEAAFLAAWHGRIENDDFNRLVLLAGLSGGQVVLLRAYARWMKQLGIGFNQTFLADTLSEHPRLSAGIVALFEMRHDPQRAREDSSARREALLGELENVASLNQDRLLRRYITAVEATVRTNYFRPAFRSAEAAETAPYLALKLRPDLMPESPSPTPAHEIFVYAPQVEGVHLRCGPIARGGIRWSERSEDYRTEVLDLMKAQQVKNALIVPEGAKGGFVLRVPHAGSSREAVQAAGLHGYETFIRGLLDLTDNVKDGSVVPPPDVRRHDGDDPYLVVAADKGTATFSDHANAIAREYGFWLGDAFASGGRHGYDHKAMGITARGAWIAVQRHFRECGIDVQSEPISIVGVGDMAGDVFGNGMLRSRAIKLIGAFNHRHIFLDPDPDPERAFAERQRLFQLRRSSWADYDRDALSGGGGVFERSAKRIELSEPVRAVLQLEAQALTPDELIRALLAAPVDLIWNGGIGTYVKASDERHADVGDKANDAVRIDSDQLRCRVVGEGGNLGMTQPARIEFSLRGGRVNTDFIDNAGGADCSDHEVNIKIVLDEAMQNGELTWRQRNELLDEMTESVAELVLHDNHRQVQALSLAERHAHTRLGEYQRFTAQLESEQGLDRNLEHLPSDETIAERMQQPDIRASGLTRPELAVLLAHGKIYVKERLVETELMDQSVIGSMLEQEFPARLRAQFAARLASHPLRRQIIATQVANDLIHHMGPTFASHLQAFVGGSVEEVVRAWSITRACFGVAKLWEEIEALEHEVPEQARLEMMLELIRLGRRASRWFLRHRRRTLDINAQIEFYTPRVKTLLPRAARDAGAGYRIERLTDQAVPEHLATAVVSAGQAAAALAIIDAAERADCALDCVAALYDALGSQLELVSLGDRIARSAPHNPWQAMERDALLDDLVMRTSDLCVRVLRDTAAPQDESGARRTAATWLAERSEFRDAWQRVQTSVMRASEAEFARYTMALRRLGELVSLT